MTIPLDLYREHNEIRYRISETAKLMLVQARITGLCTTEEETIYAINAQDRLLAQLLSQARELETFEHNLYNSIARSGPPIEQP